MPIATKPRSDIHQWFRRWLSCRAEAWLRYGSSQSAGSQDWE